MSEKNTSQNQEQSFNAERLKEIGEDRNESLASERERSIEASKEVNVEQARHEALEQANKVEREQSADHKPSSERPTGKREMISKREKNASYDATMAEVRTHMSGPSRAFSTVIHNPSVEKISEAVGTTIARPNAILSGSTTAFILTIVLYLVAKFNGYALSGTETIAAFTIGWLIGIAFDYVRLIVTGKK